jgi:hypothetical protein
VVRDSVRKAWFAASPFFNVHGHPALEAQAVLRERVHHIRAGPENSAAARIRQALRVLVAIRRVLEWEAQAQVDHRRRREDRHVRVGRRAVQVSLTSQGKKKAR